MRCGCGMGCPGTNISCPCYRNRVYRQSGLVNEYYQPQVGGDFTSYLDQVRQNQLKFQREGFKEGIVTDKLPVKLPQSQVTMSKQDIDYMNKTLGQYTSQNNLSTSNNPNRNLNQASNRNLLNRLRN
jgi:hypothetical protein